MKNKSIRKVLYVGSRLYVIFLLLQFIGSVATSATRTAVIFGSTGPGGFLGAWLPVLAFEAGLVGIPYFIEKRGQNKNISKVFTTIALLIIPVSIITTMSTSLLFEAQYTTATISSEIVDFINLFVLGFGIPLTAFSSAQLLPQAFRFAEEQWGKKMLSESTAPPPNPSKQPVVADSVVQVPTAALAAATVIENTPFGVTPIELTEWHKIGKLRKKRLPALEQMLIDHGVSGIHDPLIEEFARLFGVTVPTIKKDAGMIFNTSAYFVDIADVEKVKVGQKVAELKENTQFIRQAREAASGDQQVEIDLGAYAAQFSLPVKRVSTEFLALVDKLSSEEDNGSF